MAPGAGIPRVQLVGNRIETVAQEVLITLFAQEHRIPVLGFVPYDREVFRAGIAGEPVQSLQGTPALRSIEEITHKITQIISGKMQNPYWGVRP